ncbi:hypothetical protein ACWF62_08665 [Rhodococcus sp. NPDC054953]
MIEDGTAPEPAPGDDGSAPRARPGRPRKYASDADRVRAFRARQKTRDQQGDIDATSSAAPDEVVGSLERTLTDLRTVTGTALDQFTLAARQITAAVDRLTDPAAIDGALHRAGIELAQTKAAYETELKDLRARHETALDDRTNADAAVEAVDAELAAALADHRAEVDRLTTDHRGVVDDLERAHRIRLGETTEQIVALEEDRDSRLAAAAAEVEALRIRLRESDGRAEAAHQRAATAELAADTARQRAAEDGETAARHLAQVTAVSEQRIVELRSAAEKAAAAAATTIARLEQSVEHERGAAADARHRVDTLRDELEQSRVDAGQARTAESALREQLADLRAATAAPRKPTGDRDRAAG